MEIMDLLDNLIAKLVANLYVLLPYTGAGHNGRSLIPLVYLLHRGGRRFESYSAHSYSCIFPHIPLDQAVLFLISASSSVLSLISCCIFIAGCQSGAIGCNSVGATRPSIKSAASVCILGIK
jgi:hypothetical protein